MQKSLLVLSLGLLMIASSAALAADISQSARRISVCKIMAKAPSRVGQRILVSGFATTIADAYGYYLADDNCRDVPIAIQFPAPPFSKASHLSDLKESLNPLAAIRDGRRLYCACSGTLDYDKGQIILDIESAVVSKRRN